MNDLLNFSNVNFHQASNFYIYKLLWIFKACLFILSIKKGVKRLNLGSSKQGIEIIVCNKLKETENKPIAPKSFLKSSTLSGDGRMFLRTGKTLLMIKLQMWLAAIFSAFGRPLGFVSVIWSSLKKNDFRFNKTLKDLVPSFLADF